MTTPLVRTKVPYMQPAVVSVSCALYASSRVSDAECTQQTSRRLHKLDRIRMAPQ